MNELDKIHALIGAIENGSFAAAARQQDVSVSSIARRVAALEEDLGVRLVNRNTRRLSVTEAGDLYYRRTREAVRELEAAKLEATSFQHAVKGMLRVTLRVSVSLMILPLLARFLEANPGLSVDLALTDEPLDLLKNNIDVAVWIGQLSDSEMIARLLSPGHRIICASPDYLARRGTPQSPDDLAEHDCLAFRAANYDGVWRLSKGEQRWNIRANGPFQSSSALALMAVAASGLGLVMLQQHMVQKELDAGTLVPVLTDYFVSPTEADTAVYAVYPHSRHLAPKARAFIDFLIACFKESDKRDLG